MKPGVLVDDPRPIDADLRAVAIVGRDSHFAAEGPPLHRRRQGHVADAAGDWA